jgi:Fic family protein
MTSMQKVISKIDQLNLHKDWTEVLEEWIRTEITYSSNSIEGNTLTLIETSIIINDHQSVSGKTLRELNEATNHAKAWDYINSNLKHLKPAELKSKDILKLHEFILNDINDESKGIYRNHQVRISGSTTILPNAYKVQELLDKLIIEINNHHTAKTEDTIYLSILAHLKLVKIHPFVDGNGRTARLLMNTILKQHSLPPISINPKNRSQYLLSLENSDIDNYSDFTDFILNQYLESLDNYLATYSG